MMDFKNSIRRDIAKQNAKKGVVMKISMQALKDLEDTVVDEIDYNHTVFPGGCDMKADKASSNIIDLFVQFLEKKGIELTK